MEAKEMKVGDESMEKWKILILTPYIIMLAVSIYNSSIGSPSDPEYQIIIAQLYTIILVIALTVRWIIVHLRK